MPSGIWERCHGERSIRRIGGKSWRIVEGQHVVSTRKLVDSSEEQEILEELIEQGKPPLRHVPDLAGLHYLLFTPFRYPPLRHGSRFGTHDEPSVWYGSTRVRSIVIAGSAYPTHRMAESTPGTETASRLGEDLTAPPSGRTTTHAP